MPLPIRNVAFVTRGKCVARSKRRVEPFRIKLMQVQRLPSPPTLWRDIFLPFGGRSSMLQLESVAQSTCCWSVCLAPHPRKEGVGDVYGQHSSRRNIKTMSDTSAFPRLHTAVLRSLELECMTRKLAQTQKHVKQPTHDRALLRKRIDGTPG